MSEQEDEVEDAREYESVNTLVINHKESPMDVHDLLDNTGTFYIGRENAEYDLNESILHNPFTVSDHGRQECVKKYVDHMIERARENPWYEKSLRHVCAGDEWTRLICWCCPLLCHGDAIVQYNIWRDRIEDDDELAERIKDILEVIDT